MCGIAGIIDFKDYFSKEDLKKNVEAMGKSISHRGPDDDGVWISETGRVGLAHRRLSIIDLSVAGKQPKLTYDNRYVTTFNGEIYNFLEIRKMLQNLGVHFNSQSDTEVLLESYRVWGRECVKHFDGMFAFVIYDNKTKQTFAARDPFGEKPFYYAWVCGAFVFSSELHALAEVQGFKLNTSLERVSEYLALQYFDGDRTFYSNASKLLPGSTLTLDNEGRESYWKYFSFEPGVKFEGYKTDDLVDELEDILLRSIKRRLISDVPVGAFLSGGIDSSLVVALISKNIGYPIQTFTMGFSGTKDSEHQAAREISDFLGTKHHEKLLTIDDVLKYKQMGKILDEPNADTSILPTFLLSKFAREFVKVVISGDGADEIFGGYSRYWETINEENAGLSNISIGERYYSSRILVCPESRLKSILGRVPSETVDILNSLRSEINSSNGDFFDKLRASDAKHYMPGAVLAKVDRMSMQNGLEVRTPFLNVDLARFIEKVPRSELINNTEGKILLKKLAARYLPQKILKQKKRGFGIPYNKWAENILKKEMLESINTLDYRWAWWLSVNGMHKLLKESERNNISTTYMLWSILVLMEYLKHHKHIAIDKEGGIPSVGGIALRNKSDEQVVIFSFLDISPIIDFLPKGSKVLSPYKEFYDDNEYIIKKNWLEGDFKLINFEIEKEHKVYVIGANDNSNMIANECKTKKSKTIRIFDGNRWGDGGGEKKNDGVSLFFDSKNRQVVCLPRLIDLKIALRNIAVVNYLLARFFVINKQDYIPVKIEYWRTDTPLRTIKFLKEFIYFIRWRLDEFTILNRLYKIIKQDNSFFHEDKITKKSVTKLVFVISSLSAGGAERQVRNLAVALDKKNYDVIIMTMSDPIGRAGHYLPIFEGSNVKVINTSIPFQGNNNSEKIHTDSVEMLSNFSSLSPVISRKIWALYTHIKIENPDIVHCFLDSPNLIGGFAALISKTPKIVLSFRNSNPSHFFFYEEWSKRFYKALISSNRVKMTGNSVHGNADYAKWLGISKDCVSLTRNGVDFSIIKRPNEKEVDKIKLDLGLCESDSVICGIFRFSPEKRPLFFLDVIFELKHKVPNLKVIMVGEGPLDTDVKWKIRDLGLENIVTQVGRKNNVAAIMSISKLLLHTSYLEGTPNVVLEAQFLGIPVVATKGGGTIEAVQDGVSGYIRGNDDKKGLVEACVSLLSDKHMRDTFGKAGSEFVSRVYSLNKMVSAIEAVYVSKK